MTVNAHLEPQLDAYAALSEPGFALMVDAPWGTGKTHALKKWLGGRPNLFISLYGVRSREEIERAILLAHLATGDSEASRTVQSLVASGLEIAATRTGMSKVLSPQNFGKALLPELLVFDDLERADLPVNELLGAINRYVEHNKRNVILVANQSELGREKPGDYERVREKVIGRSISIDPDVTSALDAFLTSLESVANTEQAQAFLRAEAPVLSSVFEVSECKNLRLLKQAILEFARFYHQIPQEMRDQRDGMRRLLATFIALSIAYHGGYGTADEVLDQKEPRVRSQYSAPDDKLEEAAQSSTLQILQGKLLGHSDVGLSERFITAKLANGWIGRGHAPDAVVAEELLKTRLFNLPSTKAWQLVYRWKELPENQLLSAIKQLKMQLASHDIHEPWEILHVTGIQLSLADEEIEWSSRDTVEQEMIEYIATLERRDLLRSDWSALLTPIIDRSKSRYGYKFQQYGSPEFTNILDELTAALERAFWKDAPKREQELLQLIQDNPYGFASKIGSSNQFKILSNYARVPVLAEIDPAKFAQAIFDAHPEFPGIVLAPFKERLAALEGDKRIRARVWPSEKAWMEQMYTAAMALTEKATPIRRAQFRQALKEHLGFLEKEAAGEDDA